MGEMSWRWRSMVLAAAMCWAVAAASRALPQDHSGGVATAALVDRLLEAVDEQRSPSEIEPLLAALQERGGAAAPIIAARLPASNTQQKRYLAIVLEGIPGDASTSALLQILGSAPELAPVVLGRLTNRQINRALYVEELAALKSVVADAEVLLAGVAAQVLARCTQVPLADRVTPVVARFQAELASPAAVPEDPQSYLSGRARLLNPFLRALEIVGTPAISALAGKREQVAEDPDAGEWWVIALGRVGDASVAEELERILAEETDPYVRRAAVYAYANAVGPAAIPVLEGLLDDPTRVEYSGLPPYPDGFPIIQVAARDALWRLRNERPAAPE